jgi:hypothetical protein
MGDCEDGVHQDSGHNVCSLCGVNLPKMVYAPPVKHTGRMTRLNFEAYPQIDVEWRLSAEKFAADRQVHMQMGYPKQIKQLYCLIGSARELGRSVIPKDIADCLNIPMTKRHKMISFAMQLAIRTNLPPTRSISASLEDLPEWLAKLKGLGGLSNDSIIGIQSLGNVLSSNPEFQRLTPTEAVAVCIGSYWSSRLGYPPPLDKLAENMGLNKGWLQIELTKY